ncbi:Inositol oxygenase 5 [Senna tora]|uniref:Inositol oxygenase 5 n=1 Tax=Senna tora TaxID=362788 RepID=A0A834XFU7_9FABA|nr:Inositol oxygenase 5 [Senna tora]
MPLLDLGKILNLPQFGGIPQWAVEICFLLAVLLMKRIFTTRSMATGRETDILICLQGTYFHLLMAAL